jgi:type VI protein secretion system component Hcp
MKIIFFLCFSMTTILLSAQNVGIGTSTPNNNAILDLVSSNKALLLPRIADTSVVTAPAAGMVVYNQQSNSPNFHDGARWNNLNPASVNSLYGSMTYTVTGSATGGITYETAALAGIDFNNYSFAPIVTSGGGGSSPSIPQKADSITLFKEFDGNSITFKRAHLAGTHIQAIEISQYLPDGTKYYSIKLSDVIITSQQNIISDKTGKLTERYGLSAITVGYKDWINNKSFSYNNSNRSFGSY